MHFGRTANELGLELSLPDPRRRTLSYLAFAEGLGLPKGRLRCGAPILNCKEWRGIVYPEEARPADYLRYYAERYPSIEWNSSFYRLPTLSEVKAFCQKVSSDFRFCPKAPQQLSHQLARGLDLDVLHAYHQVCEAFGAHYGLGFMQLPDWFSVSSWDKLCLFTQTWAKRMPLAIELRHPSWFNDHMLLDPVIDLFYRRGISPVITDAPGRRDALHMSLTAPQLMVRFLGCFPSRQDDFRVKAWMQRLEGWSRRGLSEAYFFAHQSKNASIPHTVELALREQLAIQMG